jgi:hypothetical protein
MNTPPTMKRFSFDVALGEAPLDGRYAMGIVHRKIGPKFAKVVTGFEHLEIQMSHVLAVLLNDDHAGTAGYVLRAIIAPRTRQSLMMDLLQKSPENFELPVQFDEIIRQYGSLASRRNDLVHGKWYTLVHEDGPVLMDRRVFLCTYNEHGSSWLDSREVHEKELDDIFDEINALFDRIENEVKPILDERRAKAEALRPDHEKNALASHPRPDADE